jgi:hypothetical protein
MSKAKVIHVWWDRVDMALVEVGERQGFDAAEYAYEQTQTLDTHWSNNKDVEVIGLKIKAPKKDRLKIRSTGCRDIIVVDGVEYTCTYSGFKIQKN